MVPPLSDSLAYQNERDLDYTEALKSYKFVCDAIGPYSDFFFIATMSSSLEAIVACQVVSDYNLPIWLSFTLSDKCDATLRSGEPLKKAIEEIKNTKNLEAIVFNCSTPEAINAALPVL